MTTKEPSPEWGSLRTWRADSAVPVGPRLTLALVTVSMLGLIAFAWPLFVSASSPLLGGPGNLTTVAPFVLAVVLAASLIVTLVAISDGGLDVRAVALLGILSAVGAIIRPLSAGTAGVETVFILLVLGGRVFGPGFGFLLGIGTLFTSALVTGGVGPWLPYQMLAAGWVGLGAGLLPRRTALRGAREIALLVAYGIVASLVYGIMMNLSSWPFIIGSGTSISFEAGAPASVNLAKFAGYFVVTSLPWDLTRALTTTIGVLAFGAPVLATLRRATRRAVFISDGDNPVRQ